MRLHLVLAGSIIGPGGESIPTSRDVNTTIYFDGKPHRVEGRGDNEPPLAIFGQPLRWADGRLVTAMPLETTSARWANDVLTIDQIGYQIIGNLGGATLVEFSTRRTLSLDSGGRLLVDVTSGPKKETWRSVYRRSPPVAIGRSDFSGAWVADRFDNEAQPAFSNACLIRQDESTLTIEISGVAVRTYGDGRTEKTPSTSHLRFQFDGAEHLVTEAVADAALPTIHYVTPDGRRLDKLPDVVASTSWKDGRLTIESRTYMVASTLQTGTVWNTLSTYILWIDDSGQLVVASVAAFVGGNQAPIVRKTVYRRKDTGLSRPPIQR